MNWIELTKALIVANVVLVIARVLINALWTWVEEHHE